MNTEAEYLIKRHADITSRIEATQQIIAELEVTVAVPITSGDVGKELRQESKQRAELKERKDELELLNRKLGEVQVTARASVEALENQHDSDFNQWEQSNAERFTELMKSDEAKQVREFVAKAQYLYKAGGRSGYTEMEQSSEWKEALGCSDDVAEAIAKKADVFSESPKQDYTLIDQLKEMSEQNLQPVFASNEPHLKPVQQRHVTASDEEKARVRQQIKAAGGIVKGAAPPHRRTGDTYIGPSKQDRDAVRDNLKQLDSA